MTVSSQQENEVPFSLRLFGPFAVEVAGRPMTRLRSRKGHWLLALLALRAGTPVERDWLAGVLWPENEEEKALYSLRRSLADLRQALGDEAWRIDAPTPRTLCLHPEGASIDIRVFDPAVTQDDPAAWLQAVSVYSGPLLEGCAEEWVFQERDWREEAYLQMLERLAAEALRSGEAGRATEWLRQIVSIAPFRETAQRALLQALAAQQDFAGVILAYRELRLRLRRELNAAPDPETTALLQQIRRDARLRGAQIPALQDDPLSPRRAEEAKESEEEEESPLAVEVSEPPRHLPQPRTSFVGHRQVIAELCRSLALHRLVTLTGAGGGGKTRLAIQAATEIANLYTGGVWLVDLAPLQDPALVMRTIAQTLGLAASPGRSDREIVVELLNGASSDPRPITLLIMDNCEHLLETCARTVEDLLCACPRLYILATSQQALGLAGEVRSRVPSLPTPPLQTAPWSAADLADLPGNYPAVQLFLDRVRSSTPAFALTLENAPAIAQICRLLDGIPLAIELAAARARAMPLQALAQRLHNRFQLLVSEDQTTQPRHRTLRALVAWSVDLLSPTEQTLLSRLAVFRDGWTLSAAETVCAEETPGGIGQDDVLDLLTSLVDKSLVFYDPTAAEGRYSLQETIRQYAWQLLTETAAEQIQERHYRCCLALTLESELALSGPEQGAWLARLERERYNLDAALLWTVSTPGRQQEGVELAGTLARFWLMRGYWKEGRAWLDRLLGTPESEIETDSWAIWARAYNGAGALAWALGDHAMAQKWYERSLEVWKRLEDSRGQAAVLSNLGSLAWHRNDREAARRLGEQSLALRRALGDREGIAASLSNLGMIAWQEQDHPSALVYYAESLAIRRERNDRSGIATSLTNMAIVLGDQGDLERADALFAESEAIFRELEDRIGLAETLQSRAEVAYRQGEDATARQRLEECIPLFRAMGERRSLRNALLLLGRTALRETDDTLMLASFHEGAALCLEVAHPPEIDEVVEELAEALLYRRSELAVRLFAAVAAWRSGEGDAFPTSLSADRRQELKTRLGEQPFTAAWTQGAQLTHAQALALIQAERIYAAYIPL